MMSVLKDLQEMVDILKRHGYPGDTYNMHAPKNYARSLHAELQLRGIDTLYPDTGDEMTIELQNRGTVVVHVH